MKKKVPKFKKEIEQEIKHEERIIFHQFIYLKKHHQVIFALIIFVCVIFICCRVCGHVIVGLKTNFIKAFSGF